MAGKCAAIILDVFNQGAKELVLRPPAR
jgi:hypothetical protein